MRGAGSDLPERRSLYLQVREIVSKRIRNGVWPPGHFLPSEHDLAREFSVSIGTIRKAIDLLAEDNFVERRHGRGTLVSEQRWTIAVNEVERFRHRESDQRIAWRYNVLASESQRASVDIARQLEIEPDAPVHWILRRRESDGSVIVIDKIWIPVSMLPQIDFGPGMQFHTVVALRKAGHDMGRIAERYSAVNADDGEADLLQVQPGAPLLRINRKLYTAEGLVFECREILSLGGGDIFWYLER